ncbi:unnamed protein product [Didymodactylos carnosus]|nr:unnamed protein product [Didymodactylos carnosus]CAF4220698.1 unnamed protein product [Didymodactylos carnosus]
MTCEGCKGFFRRTMKERTSQRYTCLESNNCEINTSTRNICRACRFQKCINAGMSIEGSRIGRQSNLFKQKMLSMQKTGNIPSSLLNALTNNDYGMRTFGNNLRYNKTIDKSVSIVNMEEKLEPHVRSLISIIEEAYCNNIKEIPSCIDKMNIWDTCISQLEEYAKRIMNFSTEIPGFSTFAHSDHLLLIRSSVHSVILLCLCTQALQYHSQHLLYSRDYQRQSDQQYHLNLINNNNNNNQIDWNYFNAHESDLCERLQINFSVFFEIKRIMFHSIENELEHLELDDKELSLTLALLITSTVNSKLIDQKKIEQLQVDLFCALADYMDAKRGTNNKDYYVLTIQIPIIRRINSIIASSIYHLNSVCPQPFRIPKFFLQDDLLDQNRLEHNHDNFLF